MRRAIQDSAKSVLKRMNIGILSYSSLQKLIEKSHAASDVELLLELKLPDEISLWLSKTFRNSKSDLRQDLFVLSELGFKKNGFFVEFGAANGVDFSNTYLLEKEFGWNGILAEPAKCWHDDLRNNRGCSIETDCVWSNSNSTLTFNEADIGQLSTIDSYSSSDLFRPIRKSGKKYDVRTISLVDLLDKHHAPKEIDYLSIDTEGSEFEILSNFDFAAYRFKIITCEHNFTPAREKIFSLLTRNGYVQTLARFSRYDDWYVRPD
jgi:FkbM family methyltransferase